MLFLNLLHSSSNSSAISVLKVASKCRNSTSSDELRGHCDTMHIFSVPLSFLFEVGQWSCSQIKDMRHILELGLRNLEIYIIPFRIFNTVRK